MKLIHGDSIEELKGLPDESVDSIVTDPPASIGFMGKSWDSDKGGRSQWIAWLRDIMKECLRVLKPGGHALVWAIPRTAHWTATAVEDAGFTIRDKILHVFGSGFPKSTDISKQIDRMAGAKREVIGKLNRHAGQSYQWAGENRHPTHTEDKCVVTAPATSESKQWNGCGTALKPAVEEWILARKPISEKSIAENVLQHGTGGLNIDGCRILTGENLNGGAYSDGGRPQPMSGDDREGKALGMFAPGKKPQGNYEQPSGRFPANLILSHSKGCELIGMKKVNGDNRAGSQGYRPGGFGNVGSDKGTEKPSGPLYGDAVVGQWDCVDGCPVKELNRQSGYLKSGMMRAGTMKKEKIKTGIYGDFKAQPTLHDTYADEGGASRFFKVISPESGPGFLYQAKPSTRERNKGLDGTEIVITIDPCNEKNITQEDWPVVLRVGMDILQKRDIGEFGVQWKRNSAWSTLLFGKNVMEKYLPDFSCIIKMGTRSTIQSKILNYFHSLFTKEYMVDAKSLTENGGSHVENAERFIQLIITTSKRMESVLGAENVAVGMQLKIGVSVERKTNKHCTVKSVKLMRYLCKLITPSGGKVLDPFMGSGSTGIAAELEGFDFIGIEKEKDYFEIAKARIKYWSGKTMDEVLYPAKVDLVSDDVSGQTSIFDIIEKGEKKNVWKKEKDKRYKG